MNPRIRRLQSDQEQVMRAFAGHPVIAVVAAEGAPPEKYTIEFRVAGLTPRGEEGFLRAEVHRAEVFLALDLDLVPRPAERPRHCQLAAR